MEPIFLKAVIQDKIWGGSKLKAIFKFPTESTSAGEAWSISAHKNGTSIVTYPEKYAGLGLDELYAKHKDLFGCNNPDVFPLLIKIIDASDDLSVQVHPDDNYGLTNEGELGKTECWYIIDAEKDAKIVYGHNAKNREEFSKFIENNDLDKALIEVPVKAGDFYYVPAGTIHAIGKGITILETQQSSDTTYRLYDYNRKDDNGNLRELHIEKSLDVTLFPSQVPNDNRTVENFSGGKITHFLTNEFFSVYKWECTNNLNISLSERYTLATVISGSGDLEINGKIYQLNTSDSFILPVNISSITLHGNLTIIASNPEN